MSQIEKPVLDSAAAIKRIGDDRELYIEIGGIYIEDAPVQLAGMFAAIETDDRKTIERNAHSLKSASANIGAERARNVSAELEKKAEQSPMAEITELTKLLEAEITAAIAALKTVTQG